MAPELTLWYWCAALLGIAADAAATLPFMAALTLILGRRGHAALCLRGAGALAGLALWLSAAWPIRVLGDAFVRLSLAGDAPAATRLMALFAPAGLAISTSVAVWLVGAAFVWSGRRACAAAAAALPPGAGSYRVPAIRLPLILLLAAAACALAAFALRDWPFAGLPAGMDMGRAATAVGKHACRSYFMALASGGAFGLLLAARAARRNDCASRPSAAGVQSPSAPLSVAEAEGAVRWCALWAAVGYLPSCLEHWGLALGLLLRGNAGPLLHGGHWPLILLQFTTLALLTLAMAAWLLLLLARAPLRRLPLAWAGAALLLLAASAPWVFALVFP